MKKPKYKTGGLIRGGDKDRVPVMLIPGEVRISKAVFDKYKEKFFRKLNGGDRTQIICIIDEKEEDGNAQSE